MSAINWNTGTLGEAVQDPNRLSLAFCADWAPIRLFGPGIQERPGSLYSADLLALLEKADYRIVNVEAVLHAGTNSLTTTLKEGPPLIGPAGTAEDLVRAGFDIGLLANNHTCDFGPEGLRETRAALEGRGLRTGGTGSSQEDAYAGTVLAGKGFEVALVNFKEGEEGCWPERTPEVAGWDLDRVCDAIRTHRAAGRPVIAVPHADREFLPFPLPYIQAAYHRLIDAGACMVVAHHPHVPRGVEWYRGAPVFYSQGNFLFWQDHPGLFRKLGFVLAVELDRDGRFECRLHPYRIGEDGIHLLNTKQREWFFTELESVSVFGAPYPSLEDWMHAAIDAIPLDDWFTSCTGMDYGMKLMKERNPVGLARLRTRLSNLAHSTFMIAGINRVLAGQHGRSPGWMIDKVRLWTESPVTDHPLFSSPEA